MPTENESIQYTDLDEANLEITNLRTKLAKSKEETAKKTKEWNDLNERYTKELNKKTPKPTPNNDQALQTKISELEQQLQQIQAEKNRLETDKDLLAKQNQSLTSENEQLKSHQEKDNEEKNQLQSQINDLNLEKGRISQELADTKAELGARPKAEDLTTLKNELNAERNAHQITQEQLEQARRNLESQSQLSNLQGELQKIQAEKVRIEQELENKKKELDDSILNLNEAQKEKDSAVQKWEDAQQEIITACSKLKIEELKQIPILPGESTLNSLIDAYSNSQKNQGDGEEEELLARIRTLETESNEKNETIKRLEDEIASWRSDSDTKKNQLEQLTQAKEQVDRDLIKEKEDCATERADLEVKIADKETEIEQLNQKILGLESEIEELRKPDDGKHNCLENKDVEKRIEELENSELKLSAEIQKKNEEILVLKSAKSRPQSVVNSSANDLESISESLGINRYSNKTQIINKIESLLNRPNGSVSACNHYDYDKLKDKLEAEIKLLKGNIKEAEELSKQSLANLQSVGFKVTAEETKLINSAASIGKKIEVLSESNKGKWAELKAQNSQYSKLLIGSGTLAVSSMIIAGWSLFRKSGTPSQSSKKRKREKK